MKYLDLTYNKIQNFTKIRELKITGYQNNRVYTGMNLAKTSMTRGTPVNGQFHITRTSTQPAIICSNLTIETLEQGVKYVQS